MIYPDDLETRIGFDKIRAEVATFIATRGGGELLDGVSFVADFDTVRRLTGECAEMVRIVSLESDFPQSGYKDVNYFLARIRIEGTYLETAHLVELHTALTMLDELRRFFAARAATNPYPLMREKVCGLEDFSSLIVAIERIIDKFGKVRDNASPQLAATRRALLEKSAQVSRRLQQILRQAQADGYADEDSTVTLRDGRALIPISSGNKRKVRGFVHSESATGKTSFIEPVEVVELNNEIKELESAEKREIVKILTAFTSTLRPHAEELMAAGELIWEVDLVVAKARWALSNDARLPILENRPWTHLRTARHPLLEKALRKEGKAIVPLDITLTASKHILLISGPNAGGKSVCLKTVGLLQYMLQCGFLVTALDNSEMGIFDSIFIDIGDQQSIDNDLSTYSSHLVNMKTVLRYATSQSLVLIDEFGSGTEPTMGGAIAESILQKLCDRGTFGVITTHYANLKFFAASADGIENGAMTFDIQQIKPLYRLEMGRAGSSFAFEIARKIGMPDEIIAMASEKVGVEQVTLDKQLRQAARDRRYWEQKRDKIRTADKNLERTAAQYEAELAEIQKERNRLIREAKEQAKYIIAEANRKIESTIREIRESAADKEKTKTARAALQNFTDEVGDEDPVERKIRLLREKEERRKSRSRERAAQPAATAVKPVVAPHEIEVGFKVRLDGQDTVGEVINISGEKVSVAFGQLTTQVDKSRLTIVPHAEYKRLTKKNYTAPLTGSYDTGKQRLDFSQQLDVRGMRAGEALGAVQVFIDEAIMFGFNSVTILHGKGTGALKQEIRNFLLSQPIVKSVKDEHEDFGGAGISVVTFD